jgi:transcriptional regulator GlxA family with amidase domain
MSCKPFVSNSLSQQSHQRKIAIIAYPGVDILDLAGPMEVFSFASLNIQQQQSSSKPVYQTEILAEKPGVIRTMFGLDIVAQRAYSDVNEEIDTLLVPGSADIQAIMRDPLLPRWIAKIAPKVRRIASICSGAFLLAEAGLLKNRNATTHWYFSNQLASDYPDIHVDSNRIFICDGNIYTSGGITSGIDLALALVEEDWNRDLALKVARLLVMFLQRPGGQSQFSAFLTSKPPKRKDVSDLQAWVIDNPAADLSVETLAARLSMSPRNFARIFLAETGLTPAKFVELVRIDCARHYLESSDLSIERVAETTGFGDAERMRRTFIRHLDVNPKNYRFRFSTRSNSNNLDEAY